MTPKEVLYVDDALSHAGFLMSQCQDAANTLQDQNLKQQATQLSQKNQQTFDQFYSII